MPSTPGSSKRRTRSKSPARGSRSRSRSRGRSKSPSRKPRAESKSPARMSSSRTRKAETQVEATHVVQTETKQTTQESRTTQQDVNVTKTVTQERTTAVLRSSASTPTRQSARLASLNAAKDETDSANAIGNDSSSRAKKTTKKEYAMGGPIATFILMILLPFMTFVVTTSCSKESCTFQNLLQVFQKFPRKMNAYFDKESMYIVIGFHAFVAVLSALPVGKTIKGPVLKNGKRLEYRLNGFFKMVLCAAAFGCMWYFNCGVTIAYTKFYQLMSITALHALVFSVVLYARAARAPHADLAESGNTGCLTHDFFLGRELNPRVGGIDLKVLMADIGMLSLFLFNLVFLAKSYENTKTLDHPLLMCVMFQSIFIADAMLHQEEKISSIEMVELGLGFLGIVGMELVFPFLYSLTTRYLLEHPQTWNCYALMVFAYFFLSGYTMYRFSNSQKNRFRKNPNDPAFANTEKIPTSTGKSLLVSGWWGIVRHPNYVGDLTMAFTVSVLCGFDGCLVYFYPVFLLSMLVHRAIEDGKRCKQKYGAAWDRYCQRVRYVLIPYVF